MSEDKRPKAIIVDDEAHVRKLLVTLLTSMKCNVIAEGSNGSEAIELFAAHKPDLMLLDINMPVLTGDQALESIIEQFPDAFVIMLTSVADMDTITTCLGIGAKNYIRKDTPIPEMKRLIKESWLDELQ